MPKLGGAAWRRISAFALAGGLASSLAAAAPSAALAYDAMVAWLPVVDAAGYRLYAGNGGQCGSAPVDIGAVKPGADGIIRAVIRNVPLGSTISFSVTAYSSAGTESEPSNVMVLTENTVLAVLDAGGGDALASAELAPFDGDQDN